MVIKPVYIGLLGLVPMAIGAKKLCHLGRNEVPEEPVAGTGVIVLVNDGIGLLD